MLTRVSGGTNHAFHNSHVSVAMYVCVSECLSMCVSRSCGRLSVAAFDYAAKATARREGQQGRAH